MTRNPTTGEIRRAVARAAAEAQTKAGVAFIQLPGITTTPVSQPRHLKPSRTRRFLTTLHRLVSYD